MPTQTYDADYWIKHLNLISHPEGGFYYETFASTEVIKKQALPNRFNADRKYYTSIYFLLRTNQVSHFHRIKSDELWCFHDGAPLDIHVIDPEGNYYILKLGLNILTNQKPQQLVPAGSWFGASVNAMDAYSLVGCFVAPGFDFDDFELADRNEMQKKFPQHSAIINKLTI